MQAAMEDNSAVPGMIVAIQNFGSSDIHWHPHLHCLVTNGAFTPDGTFHAMEILSPSVIREIFQSPIEAFEDRHKVFRMLLKEGLMTEERVRLILSWRHFSLRSMQALPGFHIHNEGKVVANDTEGRERLRRYICYVPGASPP